MENFSLYFIVLTIVVISQLIADNIYFYFRKKIEEKFDKKGE